jgi:pimeloyl-ACP methyl ester carboxylesterase
MQNQGSISRILATAGVSLLFSGCASLTPYEEAIESLPEDRLLEIDGQRIHVEQAGSGEPLLLLHGFAASTYTFRKLLPRLAKRYRVVAIDLNGFGYTERPHEAKAYTPYGQLQAITKVMDSLGLGRATVLGHSYGATLALLLAETEPSRVQSLILISPVAEFEKPPWYMRFGPGRTFTYWMIRGMLSRPEQFREVFSNSYYQREKLTSEVSEAYRQRLLIEGLPAAFRGFSEGIRNGDTLEISFDKIEVSTLVLAGRHDRIQNLEKCRRVADSLTYAELEILEASGHSAPEEEPEAASSAILEFLEGSQ